MGCVSSSEPVPAVPANSNSSVDWEQATKQTPLFSFVGQTVTAKVVDLYDGDTLDAVLWIDGKLQRFKVRMYGYDAPEIKPLKTVERREQVIEQANAAKSLLASMVLDKMVEMECVANDKYGRLCANVWISGKERYCVNQRMLASDVGCVPYFGGNKEQARQMVIDVDM